MGNPVSRANTVTGNDAQGSTEGAGEERRQASMTSKFWVCFRDRGRGGRSHWLKPHPRCWDEAMKMANVVFMYVLIPCCGRHLQHYSSIEFVLLMRREEGLLIVSTAAAQVGAGIERFPSQRTQLSLVKIPMLVPSYSSHPETCG